MGDPSQLWVILFHEMTPGFYKTRRGFKIIKVFGSFAFDCGCDVTEVPALISTQ